MPKMKLFKCIFAFLALSMTFSFIKSEIDNLWFTSSFFSPSRNALADQVKTCSFFNKNDQNRPIVMDRVKALCPEHICQIFDSSNDKWRGCFAKNCKNWIKDPFLGGQFGPLNLEKANQKKLEYGFFRGDRYPNTLIVIAGGAFYDKHFLWPYVFLINKVLGYSCAILDYRGHENSWDEKSKDFFLFKGNRLKNIDARRFKSGIEEGRDFFDLVQLIKQKHCYIDNCIGLGICFGTAVLSIAQNISFARHGVPLFQSMALISPLPGINDLIINFMKNRNMRASFFGDKKKEYKESWLFKTGVFFANNVPLVNRVIAMIICQRMLVENVDFTQYFKKINVPTLVIASHDSDEIVTRSMALKVWRSINARHRLILWSSGVGHLYNWHHETAQLVIALGNFFRHPIKTIEDPFKQLSKIRF